MLQNTFIKKIDGNRKIDFKHSITFVLIVNLHFWNYYVPSRAYTMESPFNHLDLTSSESTFSCILAHNCHFYSHFFWEGQQGQRRTEPMSMLRPPTVPPLRYRAPHPLPLIPNQGNLHATHRHFASPRAARGIFPHFVLTLILSCLECWAKYIRGSILMG